MWDSISEWLQRHHMSKISNDVVAITYQQFYEECVKHGRFLLSKLPAKSKCGILCNDTLQTSIALCACWYANIIPIPMSFQYGEKHYRAIIDRMKPDMLITDDDNQIVDCQYNIKTRQFTGLQKMVDMDPELEDVALIMCTSGTTGLPKGIMLAGSGVVRNVRAIQSYFKVKEDDIILIPRPLYHSAVLTGEFLVGLYSGAQLIFMNQKYNPLSILSIAERTKATVLCGTPSLMNHLSKFICRSKIKLAVNKIALSGECITVDKAQNIRKAFPDTKIFNVYILTLQFTSHIFYNTFLLL